MATIQKIHFVMKDSDGAFSEWDLDTQVASANGYFLTIGTDNKPSIAPLNLVTTIPYAGNITTDLSTGGIFKINLTGDLVLENPTNPIHGRAYTWWIKQDGSTRAVNLGTKFKIPSSATSPLAWSTGGSKMDMLTVRYDSATDLYYIVGFIPGY